MCTEWIRCMNMYFFLILKDEPWSHWASYRQQYSSYLGVPKLMNFTSCIMATAPSISRLQGTTNIFSKAKTRLLYTANKSHDTHGDCQGTIPVSDSQSLTMCHYLWGYYWQAKPLTRMWCDLHHHIMPATLGQLQYWLKNSI